MTPSQLKKLAAAEQLPNGEPWPINPTGLPQCDRCDRDATRYAMPSPESVVFFCSSCDEHDPTTEAKR